MKVAQGASSPEADERARGGAQLLGNLPDRPRLHRGDRFATGENNPLGWMGAPVIDLRPQALGSAEPRWPG